MPPWIDSDQKNAFSVRGLAVVCANPIAMSKQQQPPDTNGQRGPKVAHRKRARPPQQETPSIFQPNAAGIDIGAREIYVAIPAHRDEDPVRRCGTFTGELHQMAEWLVKRGITTAAMESTGVYWIPVYDVLEQHGIQVCLVNPRNMKNVPGKRTDFHECQWIQHLHAMGLLHAAFRPESEVCAVRSLMRHRNDLVQMASQHVLQMQKALTQMNIQFQHVISDITGLTGLAILDAIVAGERDPAVLAKLRDPRIKASEETIRKSLEGNWRAEHILVLKQRLSLYRSYCDQISDCDREIERSIAAFEPRVDPEEKPLPEDRKPRQRRRRKRGGSPDFNMRTEAYKLFGVDLTQVPGLMMLVFMLFSEVGRDMSRWPTGAHFISWLGLCPDNDISGGKVLWRGARRTKNRAGTLFRLAAHSLHHNKTPLGDYLRRMKAKTGPAAATTATAHKIAIIFYTMVKNQVEFDMSHWAKRDAIREKRLDARLHKQAAQRGYKLVPVGETIHP
jgi:transposase